MDDLKRYEELVKTIEYHNDRYYNQDDPEISDYEYDMMMKELKKIEKDHPEYVLSLIHIFCYYIYEYDNQYSLL